MRSPGWRWASRSWMTQSTGGPAGTSIITARGLRRNAMNSLISAAPRKSPVPALRAQRRHFGGILVVASHRMSVIGHVQQEIAPHDAQADHADFKLLL